MSEIFKASNGITLDAQGFIEVIPDKIKGAEVKVEAVGPSLKFASAKVTRKPTGQAPGQSDAWGGESGGAPF